MSKETIKNRFLHNALQDSNFLQAILEYDCLVKDDMVVDRYDNELTTVIRAYIAYNREYLDVFLENSADKFDS